MRVRIQKWGNSLALRIPKAFAVEVHLTPDTPVDVSVVDGKLVVEPVAETTLTLEHLLAGVTEQNLHDEVDTGSATGNEIW
jgi:antitoxin MazE